MRLDNKEFKELLECGAQTVIFFNFLKKIAMDLEDDFKSEKYVDKLANLETLITDCAKNLLEDYAGEITLKTMSKDFDHATQPN